MLKAVAAPREELHRLVDALPDDREAAAALFLRFLLTETDYDLEPLTPEDSAAEEAAWREYQAGRDPGAPLSEVKRRLANKRRA